MRGVPERGARQYSVTTASAECGNNEAAGTRTSSRGLWRSLGVIDAMRVGRLAFSRVAPKGDPLRRSKS
jgi:hypothetical protein